MPEFLELHPGLLFVAATLLPLASFVLILLAFAVKTWFRKSPEGSAGEAIFQMLGGPKPGRAASLVATGAIALAFVLSLTGFVLFVSGHADHEAEVDKVETEIRNLRHQQHHGLGGPAAKEARENKIKSQDELLDELNGEWSGKVPWAGVFPRTQEIGRLEDEIAELRSQLPTPPAKGDAKAIVTIKSELKEKEEQLKLVRKYQPGTLLSLGFRIDMLSGLMFVMVTLIATLIHLFSMGYMVDELDEHVTDHHVHTPEGHLRRRGRFGRFFLYLSLFCFSMLNLILTDNLFQIFISWELVGICSYLLIGFYYERPSASNAANKAFITNRIGDAGFIIGLMILWTYVGTFNFEEIFQRVRAPSYHSHGKVMMANQVIRLEAESKDEYKFAILGHDEPVSSETRVLLFPLAPSEHTGDIKPRKVLIIGDPAVDPDEPRYATMPYWLLVAAGLGIFLGCVGKSAQFPLQVWLPDAMEGPTPVSALIHAATMVAAGVYLVGRLYPLFTLEVLLVIAYTGAITLFVAATIALVMTDIKKVLAYSTVSQLGFMMLAMGIGGWIAGLFHLITHAFFKALLFLGSGSVIYGCHHEQEMTKMGGLYPKMKTTALTMLAGVLTIAGTPFFSGWYSKDAIVAQAFGYAMVHKHHFLLFLLPAFTAGLTVFYMFRMWYMTFTGVPRDGHVYEHAHESPWLMTVPLIVLAFFSIGVAWGWPVWVAEESWLEHQIEHAEPKAVKADFGPIEEVTPAPQSPGGNVHMRVHANHMLAGNIVLGIVILAFVLATCIYYLNLLDPAEAKEQFPGIYHFLANKWYFDVVYSALLVRPALTVAHWCRMFDTKVIDGVVDGTAKVTVQVSKASGRFDNGVVDGLVNVLADTCYAVGAWLRNVQTGYLRSYVVFLVLAAVGIWVILTSLLGAAPAVK